MGLEAGTYISDLVPTNPADGDAESQGAAHLRLIKSVLQNCFPHLDAAAGAYGADLLHHNFTANVAPAVGNDSSQGYAVGSLWWDATHSALYIAQSVAVGAAVWMTVATGDSIRPITFGGTGTHFTAAGVSTFSAKPTAGTILIGIPGNSPVDGADLNVDSTGAMALLTMDGQPVLANTFLTGKYLILLSDGSTNYYILNPQPQLSILSTYNQTGVAYVDVAIPITPVNAGYTAELTIREMIPVVNNDTPRIQLVIGGVPDGTAANYYATLLRNALGTATPNHYAGTAAYWDLTNAGPVGATNERALSGKFNIQIVGGNRLRMQCHISWANSSGQFSEGMHQFSSLNELAGAIALRFYFTGGNIASFVAACTRVRGI